MEGTIGEIRMFGGSFAPRGWALCQGQIMSISNNEALYTIIGTVYGGDGQNTFGLPGMASRVAVGTGQGIGLSNYFLGQMSGSESVTLLQTQMPSHTHTPTIQTDIAAPSGTATLYGVNSTGGASTPVGNLLGSDNTVAFYASGGTLVPMASNTATITSFSGPLPTIAVAVAGETQPHNNLQPYTAINYIICMEGVFPTRN